MSKGEKCPEGQMYRGPDVVQGGPLSKGDKCPRGKMSRGTNVQVTDVMGTTVRGTNVRGTHVTPPNMSFAAPPINRMGFH